MIKGGSYFFENSLPGKFLGKKLVYCYRNSINIVHLEVSIICTKCYDTEEAYSIHFF